MNIQNSNNRVLINAPFREKSRAAVPCNPVVIADRYMNRKLILVRKTTCLVLKAQTLSYRDHFIIFDFYFVLFSAHAVFRKHLKTYTPLKT